MEEGNWIHCNFCSISYVPGMKFYFMTCSHVSCNNCMTTKLAGGRCPFDNKVIKKLAFDKMKPEHHEFFFNIAGLPDEVMQRQIKVMNFRMRQMQSHISMKRQIVIKERKLDEYNRKLETGIAELSQNLKEATNARVAAQVKAYQMLKAQHQGGKRSSSPASSSRTQIFTPSTSFSASRFQASQSLMTEPINNDGSNFFKDEIDMKERSRSPSPSPQEVQRFFGGSSQKTRHNSSASSSSGRGSMTYSPLTMSTSMNRSDGHSASRSSSSSPFAPDRTFGDQSGLGRSSTASPVMQNRKTSGGSQHDRRPFLF